MTAETPDWVENPYVGPVSFRLGDTLYGRDRERDDLLDLLIAERIVLLYSPSGAGKSSLIEAALIPALRDADFEVLPTIRVTHALPPDPSMTAPRNRYTMGVLLSLEEGVPAEAQQPVAELATMSLREYLARHADRDDRPGNEVLVFDQFEEVLTADPTDETAKHEFFRELGEVLKDRGHWALFSMREDFLAALDPYLRYIPTRFRTTFRLDLLSVPEALEAIRRPAERLQVDFTEEAAWQLVDDLRIVRVQRPSGVTEVLGSYVEPVQLQVACHLLWSMLPPYSMHISRADVEALGRVDQALGDYYAESVRMAADRTGVQERVIRDWFEEHLITPQGLRSQVLQGPAASSEAGLRLLGELLDAHLVRAETRRQATWYELSHDRLIEPVRRDNATWRTAHLSSVERAAMLWEQEGKPDRLLLLGSDLDAAENDEAVREDNLTDRQREFLTASRRADDQVRRDARTAATLRRSARRLRLTAGLTTLLAMVSIVLVVISVTAYRQSDADRRTADEARSRAQAQEVASRLLLDAQNDLGSDQDRAVALAAAGARTYPSSDLPDHVRDVLYRASNSPVSLALRGQSGPTTSAMISGDASVVIAANADDIRVWDRASGRERARLALEEGEEVNAIDATADGRIIVAGTEQGTLLLWDVEDTAEPLRWKEGDRAVYGVAWSPDEETFASVGWGTRVRLWARDGTLQKAVDDFGSSYVSSAAFSPDGRLLATVGSSAEVVFWAVPSGDEVSRLPMSEEGWTVVFGKDGATLATVSATAVTVWDLEDWTPRSTFEEDSSLFRVVDTELTQVLSVDPFGSVTVYDLASGTTLSSSTVPGASIRGAEFDTDADRVLVFGDDVDPAFWDLRPSGEFEFLTAAAVGGGTLFTAWSDGSLSRSIGPDYSSERAPLPAPTDDSVYELSADANGTRLAAVTLSGRVAVWDTTTGTPLATLDEFVWDAELTPDGTVLVTADFSGGVSTWNATTGDKIRDVLDGDQGVAELDVSPDGSTVAVGLQRAFPANANATLAVVAPLAGGETVPLGPLPEEKAALPPAASAVAFDSDGKTVIVGTDDGRLARFDAASGQSQWPNDLEPHQGEVREIVAAEDGTVLTIGADENVVMLDADGSETRRVAAGSRTFAAVLTPDLEEVVLMTEDAGAVSVPLDDDALVDLVESKVIYHLPAKACERYGLDAGC